jgi:hypothetical protein
MTLIFLLNFFFLGIYIYIYKTYYQTGGSTLEPGCAAAHPDFLKNQRKFFFLYRCSQLKKNCEHPQIKIVNTLK